MRASALLLLGLSLSLAAQARLAEYTRNESGQNQIALGVEVPRPVNSLSPLAGFRSYESVISQLEFLALQSPDLSQQEIGRSLQQRPISAWTFGQGDNATMLHTGGVHAREWASPEAVTHIIEQLVANAEQGGIESYLRDNTRIVLAPIINPDGFVATQQEATRTTVGEDPAQSGNSANTPARSLTPRDGRMRRKNLRESDGLLDTSNDSLFGVDLNRNYDPFWASSGGSSNDPRAINFHGSGPESEPETQAVIAASRIYPQSTLRLYIDSHSFGRVYFFNRTGNEPLFKNTLDLLNLIRTAPAIDYAASQESAGRGIGASDEYFSYELEVPAYTMEIEPGQNQIAEYGGNAGVSHSGFVLPETEVPRMRDEIYQMSRLAYYHQAGAPYLKAVKILDSETQSVIANANWIDNGRTRELQFSQSGDLSHCKHYHMQLQFDKPMRVRNAEGQIVAYPGQAAPLDPIVNLGENELDTSSGEWQQVRYRNDQFEFQFSPHADSSGQQVLQVNARDLANMALDANPATPVRWSEGNWQAWENEQGVAGRSGGSDRNIELHLMNDANCGDSGDTSDTGNAGSGGGSLSPLLLALMLRRRRKT